MPAPLRIAFLGFNPFGDGYDGRGKIDLGADCAFTSLDTLGALRRIRRHFDSNRDGRLLDGTDADPFDLRITGYSFGGWSALQVAHALTPVGSRFRIRMGLVDPICTFRALSGWRITTSRWDLARGRLGLPVPRLTRGAPYAGRPAQVVEAVNYFETKGLIARWNGDGFRMPFRATWFASQAIDGFENHDVSDLMTAEGAHVEIAERFAIPVARRVFAD